MNESKAIDVSIIAFLGVARRLEKQKLIKGIGVDNIIITLFMIIFSIFGFVFGMSEETIAFVIIFVPLWISMGYDLIVGICMCFFAAGLGFAGATLDPFTKVLPEADRTSPYSWVGTPPFLLAGDNNCWHCFRVEVCLEI